MKNLYTIRDYLRWAVSRFNEKGLFFGHGTDNAWDEAIALIFHTLYLPYDISPTILDARVTEEESQLLTKIITRRIEERIPVPYLTQTAWFGGLSFYVDARVLIPRSPLAELIENKLQPWVDMQAVHSILDLCTGSGCIAILLAKTFPECAVDASDISKDALAVAKINVVRHEVSDQVILHQSNLFEALPQKKYDLIISNPPYVNLQEMAELPPEFKHEPAEGLESGVTGLDSVLQILQSAHSYLNPHGTLIVEVGNSEVALQELLPMVPFTWLEFERGGGGVFLLTAEQIKEAHAVFATLINDK